MALNIDGLDEDAKRPCPNCGSPAVSVDIPNIFIVLGIILLFPLGLLFLCSTRTDGVAHAG